jgi:hypothetical protein
MGQMALNGTKTLEWGHVLLLVCAVLYLAWWCIFFRPNVHVAAGPLRIIGIACILVAAAAGITGVVMICRGIGALTPAAGGIGVWPFVIGGIVTYVLLAVITSQLMHRPITTELLLIVMWIALELCTVTMLRGAGAWTGIGGAVTAATAIALIVVLIVLLIADMVCYVLYYQLPPMAGFIDGMMPLTAVAIFSGVLVATLH